MPNEWRQEISRLDRELRAIRSVLNSGASPTILGRRHEETMLRLAALEKEQQLLSADLESIRGSLKEIASRMPRLSERIDLLTKKSTGIQQHTGELRRLLQAIEEEHDRSDHLACELQRLSLRTEPGRDGLLKEVLDALVGHLSKGVAKGDASSTREVDSPRTDNGRAELR